MVSRSTFAASPLKVATHACTEAVIKAVNETHGGLEVIPYAPFFEASDHLGLEGFVSSEGVCLKNTPRDRTRSERLR
jgi:hypothetical protein